MSIIHRFENFPIIKLVKQKWHLRTEARAHQRSQRRWRSDEIAPHLTWDRMMTGDSLWNLYQGHHDFQVRDRILEVGPGYGRLFRTALQRKISFGSYTAVELSQARVDRLAAEFPLESVLFVQGDIENWSNERFFNVVLCSSTFEHLYPDCRRALQNIHRQLSSDAAVFIDFIYSTESLRYFEADETYIRMYSHDELIAIFNACGYAIATIEECILGEGNYGPVKRYVVVATPI
ncbi:MAG TPA: class I SAM-dependent methyltransferase [Xanthobacteraceae bacterium]|nr:class I SAM-dependent methyltransferase [Xanthobacteraceae bacterium]HUN99142.1 class I SAM-dependent methyltransferase [Bradyrhizobium sp.]